MGWKLTLDWDTVGRSNRLDRRHDRAIDFEVNIDLVQGTVGIAGSHHVPDSDTLPSSCRGLPDFWTCQNCNLIPARASLDVRRPCLFFYPDVDAASM